MDTHHHDSGSEAAGAASWMVAMVVVIVLMVALFVALFAWEPWDDNDGVGGGTGTEQNGEPNVPQPTG